MPGFAGALAPTVLTMIHAGLSKASSHETHIDPLTLQEDKSCCRDPSAPPETRAMNLNAAA